MYERFIAELCRFLLDSGIAFAGDLRGCTLAEIAEMEDRLRVRLPEAFTAYLLAMGHGCGSLMEGDDCGIAAIDVAQRVALEITTQSDCPRKPTRRILPFGQHDGYTFLFFHTEDGSDPPVWVYIDSRAEPKESTPSFTCWLRECAIGCIERKPWNDEVCREISLHRDDWLKRKAVLDHYDKEANRFRQMLSQRVVSVDRERGRITTPCEFQELWNREFRTTDLYRALVEAGKRIPWGWLNPSEA